MANKTMTDAEKEDAKLVGILGREAEVEHYQLNIDNYREILKTLPTGDWPENIAIHKKIGHDSQEIAQNVPPSDVSEVSKYAHRDRCLFLKTTEELEQKMAKLYYEGAIAAVKLSGGYDDAALNVKLAAKKIELAAV